MVSRTAPQSTQSTQSQTTGPSSSTTNTSTSGSSNTTGGSTSTSKVNIRNMSSSSLAALEDLIRGLTGGSAGGGNNPMVVGGSKGGGGNSQAADNAKQLQAAWLEQLAASNQLRADYSKGAAFADSEGAASAALAEALEQSMPVISAGIDAAGTSGGALSALLTQKAAEDAARTAAQLRLDAAVSYGQIAAGALNTGAGLVTSGDPAMNALLEALGISKNAVQQGSTTESTSSFQNTSSSQNSSSTTNDSGQTATSVATQGPASGAVRGASAAPVRAATPVSTSGQSLITPSSYRSTVNRSGSSFSQFGV